MCDNWVNAKKQRSDLINVIGKDLIRNYKLPLCLLLLVLISALGILLVTQKTRVLLNEREQLLLERDVLQNEWRNLTLEENVLADPKRIERQAISDLGMRYVTQKTESVVVMKNNLYETKSR